jgi:H+/gluconate symporter-like permease
LISLAAATGIIAGATGSGVGGLGVALGAFAERYLALGISPEVIHRIGTLAGVTFDSLPHNGAVITLLTIVGFSHKEAYKPIFITTVVITTICCIFGVLVGTIFYL